MATTKKRRARAVGSGPVADAKDDSARDRRGRFVRGNRAGVGRRPKGARLRDAIAAAATPDDVRAVVAALVRRARHGDVRAANALLDRVLGRPRPEKAAPAEIELPSDPRAAAALLASALLSGQIDESVARVAAALLGVADGQPDDDFGGDHPPPEFL